MSDDGWAEGTKEGCVLGDSVVTFTGGEVSGTRVGRLEGMEAVGVGLGNAV